MPSDPEVRSSGIFFQPCISASWRIYGCAAISILLPTLFLTGCGNKKAAPEAIAPEVEVANVIQQDVPLYTECISTLDGFVNAQIQPQVTGYLTKQNYQEGTVVHKGQVLFEIDARPFCSQTPATEPGQFPQSTPLIRIDSEMS